MIILWTTVLVVYFSFAALGFESASLADDSAYTPIDIVASLACALFTTSWSVSDARRRGHPIVHVLQLLMFLTWAVAVPLYLIWSRGWKGLGWVVFHCIGLLAIATIFLLIAEWASAV